MFDHDEVGGPGEFDEDFGDDTEEVIDSVNPPSVVLYHGGGCMDGFASAWCAYTVLGDEAIYLPVQYGRKPPYTPFGARVFILDFSYPAADLMDLAENSEQVIVLDHHLSAQKELESLEYPKLSITFDMAKSGAMLAWEHFHPGEPAPLLVQYVQDRDLWQWKLFRSREFSATLKSVPFGFDAFQEVHEILNGLGEQDRASRELFFERGSAIVQAQDAIIRGLCDKAFTTRILGHNVPCVNSSCYQSEIGDELCQRHPSAPFSAIWFSQDMTSRVWSLRSRNGFDVSEVASYFGGGGHAAAASFKANIDQNIASPPVALLPLTDE